MSITFLMLVLGIYWVKLNIKLLMCPLEKYFNYKYGLHYSTTRQYWSGPASLPKVNRGINTFKRFVGFGQNILPSFVITKGNVNIFQNIIF